MKSSLITLLCIFVSSYSLAFEGNSYQKQLVALDKRHQAFSADFYQQLLKNSTLASAKVTSLERLAQAITTQGDDDIKALSLIINNLELLKSNFENPMFFKFLEKLLSMNEMNSARVLLTTLRREADSNLIAQAHYLFAQFYFQRHNWRQTLNYLDENIDDLAAEKYHHASLIKGIALQHIENHRQSIKSYQKIPSGSPYYLAAQLNIALANIRQGWWSEAHAIINDLLNNKSSMPNEIALNRLYITLGYSLLKQGYHRNALTAFEFIGLNSRYTNQAMLGIALTNANQKNYLSALNAIRYLKTNAKDDLPSDESYLLMPFFYEKSQQQYTASAGYTQASLYYQRKISQLTELQKSHQELLSYAITNNNGALKTINKPNTIQLDFSSIVADYFFINRQQIIQYSPWLTSLKNPILNQEYAAITKDYNNLIIAMAKSILQNKVDNLISYMNQAKYGLARVYDNNVVEQ